MSQILTDNADYVSATDNVVYALDGSDRILSSLASPDLYGGEGSDFLGNTGVGDTDSYGGDGNDTIHGGEVGDQLYGDDGADFITGGEFNWTSASNGVVTLFDTTSGADYIDGGEGTDALYGFDGNDTIYGGDSSDTNTTISTKNHEANSNFYSAITAGLYGGDGADYLDGGRGNDWLDGGAGVDTLYGGEDDDQLTGGAGADHLEGGRGTDYARYDFAGTGLVARLDGGVQAGDALGDTFAGIEGLVGSGNDDFLAGGYGDDIVNGFNGNDTLLGQQGNDGVYGGAGGDQLYGFDGNDTMRGGSENDFLNGNAGNDYLYGDGGADTMYGEGGVDQFVYTSTADSLNGAADIIFDFQTGVDKINLAAVPGAAGGSFSTLAAGGGYTAVDIDIGANGSIDMRIIIGPGATVAAGDFIFD